MSPPNYKGPPQFSAFKGGQKQNILGRYYIFCSKKWLIWAKIAHFGESWEVHKRYSLCKKVELSYIWRHESLGLIYPTPGTNDSPLPNIFFSKREWSKVGDPCQCNHHQIWRWTISVRWRTHFNTVFFPWGNEITFLLWILMRGLFLGFVSRHVSEYEDRRLQTFPSAHSLASYSVAFIPSSSFSVLAVLVSFFFPSENSSPPSDGMFVPLAIDASSIC